MNLNNIAKVSKEDRLQLDQIAFAIYQGKPGDDATVKFAQVLSGLVVADFVGVLDELHAVAMKAHRFAEDKVSSWEVGDEK